MSDHFDADDIGSREQFVPESEQNLPLIKFAFRPKDFIVPDTAKVSRIRSEVAQYLDCEMSEHGTAFLTKHRDDIATYATESLHLLDTCGMLGDPIEPIRQAVDTFERRIKRGEKWTSGDGGKFKLEWLGDLALDLNGQWLFKKLFPRTGVVSFYGDSRSFKTFLMIHASYCAATGNDFAGRKVKNPGPVVYIAAEDGAGVKARAIGYHMANAKEKNLPPRKDIPLAIVDAAPNLGTSPGDLKELIAKVEDGMREARLGSPSMIVADTLNQTLGSEDESTTGMQAFMANATELARHFKCCVVAVNHVGHAEKGRERGGSQIKGNADGRIWVERPDDDPVAVDGVKTFKTTLHVVKVKNGADGFDLEATLREVILGTDEDGDEESTLAVVALEELSEKVVGGGTKGATARGVSKLERLRRAFVEAYHHLANDVEPTLGKDRRTKVRKVPIGAISDYLINGEMLENDRQSQKDFNAVKQELLAPGPGRKFIADKGKIWALYPEQSFEFKK